MLTAKGEEIDRVVGFELGADELRREKTVLKRPRDTPGMSAGFFVAVLRGAEGGPEVEYQFGA